MAGIGFILRKLAEKNTLGSITSAYIHAAFASAGPWIFTIIALALVIKLNYQFSTLEMLQEFKIIIIYNFSFSLILTSPLFMATTRYLADTIYAQDTSEAPAMLISNIFITCILQSSISIPFYFFYADLSFATAIVAIINFILVSLIWVTGIFISTIKDYHSVTFSFLIGLTIGVAGSYLLGKIYGSTGMLTGFNLGMLYIIAALIAHIFAEYPYPYFKPFRSLGALKTYWPIALGGLFYNAGTWVDKWIMWFSPYAEKMPNNLISYPNYDSAMFLAYLTIIPSIAMFLLSIETSFFEHYLRFYRDIQRNATLRKIHLRHKALIKNIFENGRNFILLQGGLCTIILIMSPAIFDWLHINYLQMGIFRYGVLGVVFQALTIFLIIILYYLDNRRDTMLIQGFFFISNALLTVLSLQYGFKYYGYGYFLACLLSFGYAAFLTASYIAKLPYHSFITTNQLMIRKKIAPGKNQPSLPSVSLQIPKK